MSFREDRGKHFVRRLADLPTRISVPTAGTVIGLAAPSIQRELDEAAKGDESETDSSEADA